MRLPAILLAASLAITPQGPPADVRRPSILSASETRVDTQAWLASRVPLLPAPRSRADWQSYAGALRTRILDDIVYRGEAREWRRQQVHPEPADDVAGHGFVIRKLRFEAVPGLYVPALLYEPLPVPTGRVPVVINLNGHEEAGISGDDIQVRGISLAKKGVYALNVEWIGRGQLGSIGLQHDRMNQLDLVGTPGVAVFYESMRRSVDIAMSLPHADPKRIAVTGLSGGGWQSIVIGALDTRVSLVNAVAGFSSYVTRAQWPALDLGDSEQTPSDLASVADYTHLAALVAPRPLLLTYNAKDTCCFRADYAVGPVVQAARPIFELLGAPARLTWYVNHDDAGHRYGRETREAFYRFLQTHFFGGSQTFDTRDLDVASEVRDPATLAISLPPDNADFQSIARRIASRLPRRPPLTRDRLRAILRVPQYDVRAETAGTSGAETAWKLRMAHWTVPAVETTPLNASRTTLLIADNDTASVDDAVRALAAEGHRVAVFDPFLFGESALGGQDYLFALLVSAVGERPLGIQAGQVMAAARWLAARHGTPVDVVSYGPRTSLVAMVAAALEPDAIRGVQNNRAWRSLEDIIDGNVSVQQMPDVFPFGLLAALDIDDLERLIAPRPVTLTPAGNATGSP